MAHQTIIVLDFGSQFTQLIARRLRELSVYSEILPFDTPLEELRRRAPVGVILSGGPKSVSEAGAPHCDFGVFAAGMPVLGICYGMQLMTHALGGEVAAAPHREFGLATIDIAPDAPLLRIAAVEPARMGEPRRLRESGAGRIRRDRDERERACRGDGGGRPAALRAAVPSRGRAHRPRPRHPPALRFRRLRMHGRLDDVLVRGGGDGADTGTGRRRPGGLRTERRRRFLGRGDDRAPRDWQSADVHLRGQRRDAPGRSGADQDAVRAPEAAARVRRRLAALSGAAGRRHRPGAEAKNHRRGLHRRLRGGSQPSSDRSTTWRRARCIRT